MSLRDTNPVRIPPGCIPMKQWRAEEAQRRGLSESQLYYQMQHGKIPPPEIVMVQKSRFVRDPKTRHQRYEVGRGRKLVGLDPVDPAVQTDRHERSRATQ